VLSDVWWRVSQRSSSTWVPTDVALVFSLFFVWLKLPVISAQILGGMAVGPYVHDWVVDHDVFLQISSIGTVLLLFILGLDPAEFQRVGGSYNGAEVAAWAHGKVRTPLKRKIAPCGCIRHPLGPLR